MNDETLNSMQLVLANSDSTGRVKVAVEPFVGFDMWITHDLENLERRWADVAAPSARKGSRGAADPWDKWETTPR